MSNKIKYIILEQISPSSLLAEVLSFLSCPSTFSFALHPSLLSLPVSVDAYPSLLCCLPALAMADEVLRDLSEVLRPHLTQEWQQLGDRFFRYVNQKHTLFISSFPLGSIAQSMSLLITRVLQGCIVLDRKDTNAPLASFCSFFLFGFPCLVSVSLSLSLCISGSVLLSLSLCLNKLYFPVVSL